MGTKKMYVSHQDGISPTLQGDGGSEEGREREREGRREGRRVEERERELWMEVNKNGRDLLELCQSMGLSC